MQSLQAHVDEVEKVLQTLDEGTRKQVSQLLEPLGKLVEAVKAVENDQVKEAYAEMDHAVADYRRIFPEPCALAPNLRLATVFAAALRHPQSN